ncbi:hypothetical protein [Sporosarcina highlanderae]|uniref:Uncharacterized protein n=1 Tax=Sporosarcina highlanderae TaxID=3035916 RepID=A0ABT8JSR3_9BACL|nr:hypothetical protein [Sporosarcina highlanderae]MDN4608210.1 hypothetical protein [Sporosarcina highlanderae]
MTGEKRVVTAVIRKNTNLMHIDRYNPNSSVMFQAQKEIERIGNRVDKVIIETSNSTYIIKWDE